MRFLFLAATVFATTSFAQMPGNATAPLMASTSGRTLLYTSPVTHIGAVPKTPTNLKEGGAGPFLVMFNRILPTGWAVWQGAITEPLPQAVQWGANKPWYDALGDVLVANNLRADVDWNSRTIVLHTQRLIGPPANSPILVNIPPPTNPPSRVAAPPAPPPKAEITTWTILPSDTTLRNAMQRWSKDAGWSLVYEASNYAFDSFAEFEGDFKPAVCRVLANINASLAESKKSAPLNAGFWTGNKTIRIFDVRGDNTVNAPDTCEVMNTPRAKPASAMIDEGPSAPGGRLLKAAL
jgi:hypothetical protein